MNAGFGVKTSWDKDTIRQQISGVDFAGVRESIISQVVNLQDKGITEALINMGWVPPNRAIPDGYKLVPVDPSTEQRCAGIQAAQGQHGDWIVRCYQAMIGVGLARQKPYEVKEHVKETHVNCSLNHCPICDGGLFYCINCGGAEGSLTKHCPGYKIPPRLDNLVYTNKLDFVDGEWVTK